MTSGVPWPGCEWYYKPADNLRLCQTETRFGDTLKLFKDDFDKKITKLKDIRIAQVNLAIRNAPGWRNRQINKKYKAKSAIKDIFNEKKIKGKMIDSVYAEHNRQVRPLNQFHMLSQYCENATERYWMEIGETDDKMKTAMNEAGIHVDHYLNYDDIRQLHFNAESKINQSLASLPRRTNVQLWLDAGKKKSIEMASEMADETKARIILWQTDITARADKQNNFLKFLQRIMDEAVAENLKYIDEYVRKRCKGEIETACDSRQTDTRDNVIKCLTKNAAWDVDEFLKVFPKIIKFISFVNVELELKAIGH